MKMQKKQKLDTPYKNSYADEMKDPVKRNQIMAHLRKVSFSHPTHIEEDKLMALRRVLNRSFEPSEKEPSGLY